MSEKLEYIPACIVVNRYIRPQYGCNCCQCVISGEMPAHIIPKSVAEPSLIAQLVIGKHTDHMPLYRQQPVLARSDIHLPISTMADMVGRADTALVPLAEAANIRQNIWKAGAESWLLTDIRPMKRWQTRITG